jgi:hypothetical protein
MEHPRRGKLHEVVNKQQDIEDNAFSISKPVRYRKELLAVIRHPNPILEKFVQTLSTWLLDHNNNGTSLIVQGDEEKSGTIRPAKDEEFAVNSLFLILTIITMSCWYLSNKKL